jgi:hypothetical protein
MLFFMGFDNEEYKRAIDGALAAGQEVATSLLDEAAAEELAAWLADLSPAHRRLVLHNLPAARQPEVLQHLLAQADRHVGGAPSRLLSFSRAAVAVAQALESRRFPQALVPDRRAQAWCCLANAYRVLGNHRRSEVAFELAENCARSGSGDPLLAAAILTYESSLRRSQRRMTEAAALLAGAAAVYSRMGDRTAELAALSRSSRSPGLFAMPVPR